MTSQQRLIRVLELALDDLTPSAFLKRRGRAHSSVAIAIACAAAAGHEFAESDEDACSDAIYAFEAANLPGDRHRRFDSLAEAQEAVKRAIRYVAAQEKTK